MSDKKTENTVPSALTQLAHDIDGSSVTTWQQALQVFSRWGRQSGQERWDLKPADFTTEQKSKIIKNLTDLGFIQAIVPEKKHYDYAVIPGATVNSMIQRLSYLTEQWKRGVHFDQLIFLTGIRPLTAESDNFVQSMSEHNKAIDNILWDKTKLPCTETEAAELIYKFFPMPKEMRNAPYKIISVRRTWLMETDQWQRANTAMTIDKWLQKKPASGTALIVSSQPHAHYQHQVFFNNLPASINAETIAPACAPDKTLEVKLDAVWLWIKNRLGNQPTE